MATCAWHQGRETAVTCGNCGRPICTRCMVQHPVGIRCRECARLRRLPTFQVTPAYLARATAAALVLGGLGGVGLTLLSLRAVAVPLGPVLFYVRLLALVGVAYVVGEGVSLAVNRKRGRVIQVVAAAGVVLSVIVSFLLGDVALVRDIFGLVVVAIAVFVAASRVGA